MIEILAVLTTLVVSIRRRAKPVRCAPNHSTESLLADCSCNAL